VIGKVTVVVTVVVTGEVTVTKLVVVEVTVAVVVVVAVVVAVVVVVVVVDGRSSANQAVIANKTIKAMATHVQAEAFATRPPFLHWASSYKYL
jgi:hypothetical protein